MKKKIFLALYVICVIVTFVSAILVITKRIDNPGLSIISMLLGLIFSNLYNSEKEK